MPLLLWTPDWHLFSRPFVASLELSGGLSRHYSCGYPIGISFQVRPWRHLTPDWHFFSRPLRGIPRVYRRSLHYSCGHPIWLLFYFAECHLDWLDYPWHSFALF